MSPLGALIVALVAIALLGSLAGWLLNVPLWVVAGLTVAAVLVVRPLIRRRFKLTARQDTEG